MSNNKQSSVELLAKLLLEKLEVKGDGYGINSIIDLAKVMHKQEMIDFGNDLIAQSDINYIGIPNLDEQYYNETYGGNK
jgi:hypothetical protein